MQPDNSPRAAWVTAAALFVGTALLYARSLPYPLLSMDDPGYPGNPHVVGGLTADNVRWALTTGEQANWHPLTWLSLQLDATLWGADDPAGFRATNVLLHAANAALVYAVLRAMTGAAGRSLAVAALWAAHPLHVESVVWITERKDMLSTLFWLLTTAAYVGYARRPGVGRYLLVAALLAVGLTAKPMLVTLPCVFLLLDYWPLGRMRPDGPRSAVRLVVEKLPLLAVSAVMSAVTVAVQDKSGALGSYAAFGLGPRTAMATVAYATYLGQTVWPAGLGPYYPLVRRSVLDPGVLAAAGLLVAVTAGCLRWGRRYPYLPVGWLWFVGTLVPVVGLVQIGGQDRADRYTYVPHIGLFVAGVWGAADLLRKWPKLRAGLAAGVVAAAAAVCWAQIGHWRDAEAVWEQAVAATDPTNAMARLNLGFARRAAGRLDDALDDFRAVVASDPTHPIGHAYLGATLSDLGREDEGIPPLMKAVELDPTRSEPKLMLARVLVQAGRAAEAVPYFQAAGVTDEAAWPAAIADGRGLLARGEVAAARERFAAAAKVAPDLAEPPYLLGLCDELDGKPADAERHFRAAAARQPRFAPARVRLALTGDMAAGDEAARLAPTDPAAHAARGLALLDAGREADARGAFAEAAKLSPTWAADAAREAWAILDGPGWKAGAAFARTAARQACEVSGYRDPSAVAALAAAEAAAGRFPDAAGLADRAAGLAAVAGRPATADEYRRQADRYRAGKPHRD